MGGESKRCWQCGAEFLCGAGDNAVRCWCDELPPISPSIGSDCLCAVCLAGLARQQAGQLNSEAPSGAGNQTSARSAKLVEGEDYYDEGSMIVFTARYHLRRGFCCKSGCRHCPYRFGTEVR